MARFVLERMVPASPAAVCAASLDPALHVRSMARHRETMIHGPHGAFTEGAEATWRAWHFGIPFRLSTIVFDVDEPHAFRDRQTRGPFHDFLHVHEFEPHPGGALMRDTVTFHSPLGPIGALVDRLLLRAYLRRLVARRNDAIEAAVRSGI